MALAPATNAPSSCYIPSFVLIGPDPHLECFMSKTSYARRKAHRALGREFKEGKLDEGAAKAYQATEEKRQAKIKEAKEKAKK